MYAFLYRIIKYPKKAIRKNITGVVYAGFVVEKDGQISNVKILRDIGGGCGKEVLRVINAMPKWKPGIFNGEPVRTEFVLPITFNLESNVSEEHDREFLQTACDEF
jgi:TonB family protein